MYDFPPSAQAQQHYAPNGMEPDCSRCWAQAMPDRARPDQTRPDQDEAICCFGILI